MNNTELLSKVKKNIPSIVAIIGFLTSHNTPSAITKMAEVVADFGFDFLPASKTDSFFKILSINTDILALENALEIVAKSQCNNIEYNDINILMDYTKFVEPDFIDSIFYDYSDMTNYKWLVCSEIESIDEKFKDNFINQIKLSFQSNNISFNTITEDDFINLIFDKYTEQRKILTLEYCNQNSKNIDNLWSSFIISTHQSLERMNKMINNKLDEQNELLKRVLNHIKYQENKNAELEQIIKERSTSQLQNSSKISAVLSDGITSEAKKLLILNNKESEENRAYEYYTLARLNSIDGLYKEALNNIQKAYSLNNKIEYICELILLLLKMGNISEAINYYSKAIELFENTESTIQFKLEKKYLLLIGTIYYQINLIHQAQSIYEQLLCEPDERDAPSIFDNFLTIHCLAHINLIQNKLDESIRLYKKGLIYLNDNPAGNVGNCFLSRYARYTYYQNLIDFWYLIGRCYLFKKDFSNAKIYFDKIIKQPLNEFYVDNPNWFYATQAKSSLWLFVIATENKQKKQLYIDQFKELKSKILSGFNMSFSSDLLDIASYFMTTCNFHQAKYAYKMMHTISSHLEPNNAIQMITDLNNLGLVSCKIAIQSKLIEDMNCGINYFKKALKIVKQIQNSDMEYNINLNLKQANLIFYQITKNSKFNK